MHAEQIGLAAMQLGAGRQKKEDPIDMLAGIRLCRKVGEAVRRGDPVAVLYTSDEARLENAEARILSAIRYDENPPVLRPHILGVIGGR